MIEKKKELLNLIIKEGRYGRRIEEIEFNFARKFKEIIVK